MKPRTIAIAAAIAAIASSTGYGQLSINEIRVDNADADINEYFELAGPAAASLSGLTYIVIGDGVGASGVIEEVTALAGSIPADGYFLVGDTTVPNPAFVADVTTPLNFENDDTYTHLLVSGFTGADAQDLDTNDDGTLDVTPWTAIVDCVAFIAGPPDAASELADRATQVGPDPIKGSPWHLYRFPNGSGPWLFDSLDNGLPNAQTDPANYLTDTPGGANVPEPATLSLIAIGAFFAMRRNRC